MVADKFIMPVGLNGNFFEMNGSLKALTTYYKFVIKHEIVTIKVSYVKTRYNKM